MGTVTQINKKYTLSKENVVFFTLLHVGALLTLVPSLFSWSGVFLMLFLYWLTASLGICLGFHRYLTHKSFDLPRWVAYPMVFFGTLACENGPITWVGHHRMHHASSDTDKDPHNARRGFWWSHFGWLVYIHPDVDDQEKIRNITADISHDKFYQFLEKNFMLIQVAFGLTLLAIGGLPWVIWGVFARLVLVYHVTWLVNSAAHKWGYCNFELEQDLSTNCWWVGLLAMGEGWHNNHHAFPRSARHGLRPWEFDITWVSICILKKLGLATNVKVVEMERLPKESNSSKVWFKGEMVKKAA